MAFGSTTGITFLLSTYASLLSQTPDNEVHRNLGKRFLWKSLPGGRRKQFWRRVLERLILGLSDQQLITGTAMLIMGFSRLPVRGGYISCYDFTVITNIALFSGITHMITIRVMADYF